MDKTTRKTLLGIFDCIIAISAIRMGFLMIRGEAIFTTYPKEWLSKLPFQGWYAIGVIAIVFFGFGNLIAALSCFLKKGRYCWVISGVMSIVFAIALILQVILLGEIFLATVLYFIVILIQLTLCGYTFSSFKKTR